MDAVQNEIFIGNFDFIGFAAIFLDNQRTGRQSNAIFALGINRRFSLI